MTRRSTLSLFVITFVLSISMSSCRSSGALKSDRSAESFEFKASKVAASSLLSHIGASSLRSVKGKARVAFSSPELSERGVADFMSDEIHSFARLRNGIGIEGAQILVDADSVLSYFVFDRTAWKFSILEYETRPEIKLRLPLNLLQMIRPMVHVDDVVFVEENADSYKIHLKNKTEIILHKTSLLPQYVRLESSLSDRFTEFRYEAYAQISGTFLPRRIQATTADRESRIQFDIIELEINPDRLQFGVNIPASVPIFRFKNEL